MRERAAAFAQHAEAVRIVDDEPRVVRSASSSSPRQRREVAVHAEHRVGAISFRRALLAREPRSQRGDVAVRVANEFGARQQRRVVEAGVIEPVGEHGVAAPRRAR